MNREELLYKIMQIDFALVDLNLYLNTHPCDKPALERYCSLNQESKTYKEKYECMYGPLTASSGVEENYFAWISEPWPWEKAYNPEYK